MSFTLYRVFLTLFSTVMEMKHARETRWQASELKFLVTPDCAAALKQWARRTMDADPFASSETGDGYLTTSLYLETPRFDVFHENGSYGHAKYRIRRYGNTGQVFLERKLRNNHMVAKRRSIVDVEELHHLDHGHPDPAWEGAWFHRRVAVRGVSPVCQVSYQRTARVLAAESGAMRLTIDEDLRAMRVSSHAFSEPKNPVPLLRDTMIVEMKFRHAMPELFRAAVREFGLTARTVSKYKLAARELGLVESAIRAVA